MSAIFDYKTETNRNVKILPLVIHVMVTDVVNQAFHLAFPRNAK